MIYVKLLQIIAVQNVFSSHINEFLLTYTDDVSYDDDEIDNSFIELFPNESKENFELIKSGTMSLIYKLDKPNPLIVKVLRKNIKNKIDISISNMNFYFIFYGGIRMLEIKIYKLFSMKIKRNYMNI